MATFFQILQDGCKQKANHVDPLGVPVNRAEFFFQRFPSWTPADVVFHVLCSSSSAFQASLQGVFTHCIFLASYTVLVAPLIFHIPVFPKKHPSIQLSLLFFLSLLSPSASVSPKTLPCPPPLLTFHPLTLFPASQPPFIFPRLDYCKALPVCQHSWKLFISAPIHLGRQRVRALGEWWKTGWGKEEDRGRKNGRNKEDTRGESHGAVRRWISEPLVVNLHSALRWLMGNFPAGLLAVCKTPTQSWEHTTQGMGKYA